jgi:3-hydroxyisobutyrate dehydrogenase
LRDVDTVILMLPDSNVVETVVGSQDFLAAVRPGSTVVDMSSSEPTRTQELAHRLADHAVRLIDAPVSGGVAKAISGELAIMVGGDDDAVEPVADVLHHFGRIYRAGPVGAGHAVKALNNLMSGTHLLITTEAMLVAQRFGIDARAMLDIVNASSGRSGSTENKWPNYVLPGTYDSGFSLALLVKDMRIALELAAAHAMPSPLAERALALWTEAAERMPRDADHTEIVRWCEQVAGATSA